MQEGIEQNALELLNAIREHHPDIYAGAWVNPYTAALEVGLDPDSTNYRVAMEYLQAEDVLEEAEESRELGGGGPLSTLSRSGAWRCCEKCDFGFSRPRPRRPPGVVSGQGCSGARVLQTFVAANICSHLASTKEPPSTRDIPAPDCRRANSRDSCEVPSVWCGLRERSRFLRFFAPKHIIAKGHPTGSCLLQKLRAGRAVEDPDNLIRAAPRASTGSVHTSP